MALFEDRGDAGRKLAKNLAEYRGTDALILALPRGGVAVGYEVAMALDLPLEVFIARKIGAPGNPELAVGAVAEMDGFWDDQEAMRFLGVAEDYLSAEISAQREEIDRRIRLYRRGRALPPISGRTVIVTDDGIATGYTMLAALKGIRTAGPRLLVAAVPVAPAESLWMVSREADRVECLDTPEPFYAVGLHYDVFTQLSDQQVVDHLERARQRASIRGS